LKANNIAATLTPTPESIKALAPNDIKIGPLKGREGYANPVGGWAEAARATKVGLGMVVKEGGVVRGGCEVVGLQKDGKRVEGVVLKSGEVVRGDVILVCSPPLVDSFVNADDRLLLELGMSSMRVMY
jgi:sarcosine oxidase/L-pipecolate oxidase